MHVDESGAISMFAEIAKKKCLHNATMRVFLLQSRFSSIRKIEIWMIAVERIANMHKNREKKKNTNVFNYCANLEIKSGNFR